MKTEEQIKEQETIKDIVSYTHQEKENIRKRFFIIFLVGLLIALLGLGLQTSNLESYAWARFLIGFAQGIWIALLVLVLILTSGKTDNFYNKKHSLLKKHYK